MKTMSCFEIGMACRAGVLSSLMAFASAGNLSGQEPLVLDNLKLLRPPNEACTITFSADEGQQIAAWSSSDLKCWTFAGGCDEIVQGSYQFIDLGAVELPGQFYRFECFNPEIALPPQFEQLRAEMGDEQFAQWLESNSEQFGTLQGVTPEQVDELHESEQEQFQEVEELLHFWLKDFRNEAAPLPLEFELPTVFEEARVDWGDYDLAQLLVDNLDLWGNLQGVCEPLIIEWKINEPLVFEKFQFEEQALELWLESYLVELPPIVLENFEEEENPLPPHLEQLRLELGDEAFAEWLHRNLEELGNLQGIPESQVPENGSRAREEFDILEGNLQGWLNEFEKRDPQ